MFHFHTFFKKLRVPVLLLVFVLMAGAGGYRLLLPNVSWERALFMTAVTVSTVGYGDMLGVEKNSAALWYTMGLMLTGMGVVLYAVSALTAVIVEGELRELFIVRGILRGVARMKNHYIVCGAGQTGIHVAREIQVVQSQFVIIEQNPDKRDELRDLFPGVPVIIGDATSDEVLNQAGIKNARGFVATLSNDKDNLFLTISARLLNAHMKIVSKAVDMHMRDKLHKAGANHVVSPNFIGGIRIAAEILRPHVVTFIDRMLRGKEGSVRMDELVLPAGSELANRSLGEIRIPEKTGLMIIAYSGDGSAESYVYNPGKDLVLREGGVLVFIGTPEQSIQLKEWAGLDIKPADS